jgi:tRNA(adenine34) deaminase
MNNPYSFIDIAIEEAKQSLQDGNSGFGAVVIRDNNLVSKAHDTDSTSKDPTSHAEINAIRLASIKLKGDFNECMLVSTHEPCPMCSTAIVWSGIKQVAYGYSIADALNQGRKRINLTCNELFNRAGADIKISSDVKKSECSLLYNHQIRENIKQLRNADSNKLEALAANLKSKRISWFNTHQFQSDAKNPLDSAYELFLNKLGISSEEAPIVNRQENKLVIHSENFCPTLEACKILGMDTRDVCKKLNEEATQVLLQQIDSRLVFKRNYDAIRPYKPYCEEMIILEDKL